MAERYRSPKIYMPVDDVEVTLEEFDTDDLIRELAHRRKVEVKKDDPLLDDLRDVHEELRSGRVADAIVHLEKIIWPKWRTIDGCADALARFKSPITSDGGVPTSTG